MSVLWNSPSSYHVYWYYTITPVSYVPFDRLSDSTRLWIFASDRELSKPEEQMLIAEMQTFVQSWTAHNAALLASCDLRHGRFLFIAVNEAMTSASGCSIDEMMRRVRMIGETYGIEFFGMPRVQYRDASSSIRSILRSEFAELATKADVMADTIVFDNTISTLADLTNGKWELPAKNAWHAKAFDLN